MKDDEITEQRELIAALMLEKAELMNANAKLGKENKMLIGLLRETPKRSMCDDLRHRVCAILREGKDKES